MQIKELTDFTTEAFEQIKVLMYQLDDAIPFTEEKLQWTLNDPNAHIYVILDADRIIGCATLAVFYSPTGRKASVEDVVVLDEYRGQHLGRQIIEHVIDEARKLSPVTLQLTSNPTRVSANALYKKVGFKYKETNSYRLPL